MKFRDKLPDINKPFETTFRGYVWAGKGVLTKHDQIIQIYHYSNRKKTFIIPIQYRIIDDCDWHYKHQPKPKIDI